jgi:hypothetical protein
MAKAALLRPKVPIGASGRNAPILFEDNHVMVLNKPAGVPTQVCVFLFCARLFIGADIVVPGTMVVRVLGHFGARLAGQPARRGSIAYCTMAQQRRSEAIEMMFEAGHMHAQIVF